MRLQKEFNKYLADLAVLTFKLHNLHWNVQGNAFVAVHEFTESIYDQTFAFLDTVAEHQKIFGVTPDSRLSDYLVNAEIKEIDARVFGDNEALQIVADDLQILRRTAVELRAASDAEGWFSAVSFLEEQIAYYDKQLWFIRATLG